MMKPCLRCYPRPEVLITGSEIGNLQKHESSNVNVLQRVSPSDNMIKRQYNLKICRR
jgi:hypothetical protein